jgi:hypothetical protein
MVRKGKTGM